MHPISQVKSVGEKMETLPALEEKECKGPNGSVANFGSRCRKYRRSGSTADREVAAKIEMWCAGREAGGFLSTNR